MSDFQPNPDSTNGTVTMAMRPTLFCAPPLEEMLAACEKLSDQVSYERHQLLEQKSQIGEISD
jgi:hypothetical protein